MLNLQLLTKNFADTVAMQNNYCRFAYQTTAILPITKKQNSVMENKKLGQEPAFPITEEQMDRIEQYPHYAKMAGMSKRFYAACAVMQGLSADPNVLLDSKGIESMVELSYKVADELLKQEFDDEN